MAAVQYQLDVSLAWWLYPYLYGLIFFCWLCHTLPDPRRVERMVYRAVRVHLRLLPPGG